MLAAAFSHLSLIYFGTLTNQTPLALLARSSSLSAFDLDFSFGVPFEVEAILNFENNPGQKLEVNIWKYLERFRYIAVYYHLLRPLC